jgi:hypothetical protein
MVNDCPGIDGAISVLRQAFKFRRLQKIPNIAHGQALGFM